jgi:hypothetical protein
MTNKPRIFRKLVHRFGQATVFALLLLLSRSALAQTPPSTKLIALWDFNDASVADQTKDSVKGYVGVLENGVVFSADQGGRTAKAGDRGMDFGTASANRDVLVTDFMDAFNAAAADDQITVSFWQKWNVAIANSSAFWFVAPSVNGTSRGFQAHAPYGSGVVYFDTAGCCTANTQRINTTPAGVNWQLWHHLAFVKNGPTKQIWLDGTMLLQGTGANPLPTDFTQLVMGRDFTGANNTRSVLDDFAVFASALDSAQIKALSGGMSPKDLDSLAKDTDGDGMTDVWETKYGLAPNDATDAAKDADSDGLTNLQEFRKGTDPKNPDTDGDGLKDGAETGTGKWVSATDTGTDPLNPDVDGDGLLDGVETNTGRLVDAKNTGTDPNTADTDVDGIPDGAEFVVGSSPVDPKSLPNLGTGVKLIAYWDFNSAAVSTQTVDKVHTLAGNLLNGAAFSADGGGRTSKPGDRAMNFGAAAAAGKSVNSTEAGPWLSAAAAGDRMTVSFWQKWNGALANSSAFWMVAPSVNGTARGLQAHTPYGTGGVIYFDTAGCCDAATQRISANINTFDNAFVWTQWHHFAFVKDGATKQIWIDGKLFLEGSSTGPLPTDIKQLVLGLDYSNPAQTAQITMDDFAVYASALSESRITALSYGLSPLNVESATGDADNDGLPDWWEDLYGLNKNVADASQDADSDGLTNLQEFQGRTDPKNADTDGDGLRDGAEITAGADPLKPDTDGDGLNDGAEIAAKTNPLIPDTDGDTYSDATEALLKSNPTDPNSVPLKPNDVNLLAYWDFNDASVTNKTVDKIGSYAGELLNGVVYTADQGGRTGRAGDRGMNFGTASATDRAVRVAGAYWLNAGGVPDTMTISFWQKWNVNVANSSAFWMVSPKSADAQRGVQAHTPYGDSTIYFDTGGAAAGTTRISANLSTFTNVAANSFFTNWHHFAFVKNNTTKQIWIDGKLFLEGQNSAFLPIDFTDLYLGNQPGTANNLRAVIDDFAVYATALPTDKLSLLAEGASPIDFKITLPPPVVSFSIRGAVFNTTNQSLAITWESQSGKKYVVQRSSNLKDWTTLATVDAAAGATTSYSDTTASAGARIWFYRIQAQ